MRAKRSGSSSSICGVIMRGRLIEAEIGRALHQRQRGMEGAAQFPPRLAIGPEPGQIDMGMAGQRDLAARREAALEFARASSVKLGIGRRDARALGRVERRRLGRDRLGQAPDRLLLRARARRARYSPASRDGQSRRAQGPFGRLEQMRNRFVVVERLRPPRRPGSAADAAARRARSTQMQRRARRAAARAPAGRTAGARRSPSRSRTCARADGNSSWFGSRPKLSSPPRHSSSVSRLSPPTFRLRRVSSSGQSAGISARASNRTTPSRRGQGAPRAIGSPSKVQPSIARLARARQWASSPVRDGQAVEVAVRSKAAWS